MNIVSIILKLLGNGDIVQKIASKLGISSAMATKAIGAAVPTILAGVVKAASNPGGAGALANVLKDHDGGVLDNLGGLFSKDDTVSKGNTMLDGLLGGDMLGKFGGVLSKFTGVGQEGTGKLMGMLAPVVMGAIGKQAKGMDASGIASLLGGQKENIASALPAGLGDMLGSAIPGLGGMLGGASKAADSVAKTAYGTAKRVEKTGSSFMKWLVPLILAALALILLPKMCKRAADVAEDATGMAADAVAATADGTKFVSQATDLLKSATGTIASINDEASAQAALPKLREVSAGIGGLGAMMDKLPAAVQSTVRVTLRPLIAKLREAAQPVLSIPVVGSTVKPVLDEIFGHLDALVPPM